MSIDSQHILEREQKRKEIFQQLKEDFSLPSPSGTVIEVIRLCNDESSSLSDIAEVIQTDPSLSAEIIKYANSAFLSTGVQVASIQKATVKLGMKTVVNLALGFSLLADNKTGICENFDYNLYWRTSLAEALAARELARRCGEFDPDELFVCGLLAHMGRLTFSTIFPYEYNQLLIGQPQNSPPKAAEFDKFGLDSSELTVELFLSWGLPAQYALATGFHEDIEYVELGTGKTQRAAAILLLAHNIGLMCQSDEPLYDLLDMVVEVSDRFEIILGSFTETFRSIVESWHEHGRIFEIQTSDCYSYNDSDP